MPLVYADTSALFAACYPADCFAQALASAIEKFSPEFVYWSFLRYELRHNLRRVRGDEDGEAAWACLRASERANARFHWHSSLDCESVLDTADQFSAQQRSALSAGSSDLIHIAAAQRIQSMSSVKEFWTCDAEQASVAKSAGLKVRLFKV